MTRIFKIGQNTILEDPTMAGKSIKEVQTQLSRLYPEVAHATYRSREEDGVTYIEFLARPGRKG